MPAATLHARSLTELIHIRATQQPDEPAIHTGAAEFGEEFKTLTYSDLLHAVNRLCTHYSTLNLQPDLTSPTPPERIIAVLTSTAVDESILEIALAKLGLTALLLSINNSIPAIAHLCKQTKSTHLIYGSKFQTHAEEARELLAKEGVELEIIPETRFPLWGSNGVRDAKIPDFEARLSPDVETGRTCVILHSSGSTGFPKPVYVTHYGLLANCAQSIPKTGFSALPLFHGFGHFSIFRCIYNAKTFTLMPPHLPLTSANICRIIRNSPTKPVQHFAVPYVLKLLAETEEGVKTLAGFEAVSFAGAAVPDDLGDRLVAAGVPLISVYGTTETGALLNSRRDCKTDLAWNWLRLTGPIAEYVELIPQSSDTFELVVLDGWPAKIMSNRSDGAYCTKDLFLRHPLEKDWFKYIGRLDDTLTQTLGEKTNPVPIELAIRGNSPLVQECIVFGDGRPQCGALILPSEQGRVLAEDRKAFLDALWPVIAEANAAAPTHSRILPEMIEIIPYGTEIPVATKMSILRPACYKKFSSLITSIYDRFECGTGAPKQRLTTLPSLETFIKQIIITTIGGRSAAGLEIDTDLFTFGIDSLTATRIRNEISKGLEMGEDVKLGQNVVYEHPSITDLAKFLLDTQAGGEEGRGDEGIHGLMVEMVQKFSVQVKDAPRGKPGERKGGAVVVLTGATGSLGAHILDQLIRRDGVTRVICLSRASSHSDSMRRIQDSLSLRQRTLSQSAMSKITSLAADVNLPNLGLDLHELNDLKANITHIIHNAWPVNFNLSLNSFEPHIQGAVNLLKLALASDNTASFHFSSSVGTVQGRPNPLIKEVFSDSPATAGGMGYARSKWVMEGILERCIGIRVGVLRIGQLVGDTECGVWNETEAWPLMFKSANTIHALPLLDERPSWLPVNLAARAISEIVLSPSPIDSAPKVYHVLNPHISSWSTILKGLHQGGLEFDEVDRRVWLDRLRDSEPDVEKNPTFKLLQFYTNRIGNTSERAHMDFEVSQTSLVSPTIGGLHAVSADLVELWVRQWKKSGFMV